MSYFPFFREIEGEKCLVIGGGKVATRKISRLKGFGVKTKVAKITKAQVKEIAELKMPDLNAASVETAMSMIEGTCRSMGVTVVED